MTHDGLGRLVKAEEGRPSEQLATDCPAPPSTAAASAAPHTYISGAGSGPARIFALPIGVVNTRGCTLSILSTVRTLALNPLGRCPKVRRVVDGLQGVPKRFDRGVGVVPGAGSLRRLAA